MPIMVWLKRFRWVFRPTYLNIKLILFLDMDIKEIALEFGIEFGSYSRPAEDALAQVYILDDRFVLRGRNLDYNTLFRYHKELVLLKKVRKLIPFMLPEPMDSKNGDKWVISDNLLWTMYPIIKGDIVCSWQDVQKASEEQTKKLLGALRKIHDLTIGRFSKSEISNLFREEIETAFSDVKADISENVIKRVSDSINLVFNQKSDLNRLCFVHGDFHHGNMIVDGDKIVGFIDFDWCRVGNPLEDLAFTAMMLLRDYRKGFRFDEAYLDKILGWYGLEPRLKELFLEYLILYVMYDVYVFKHASMNNHEFYYRYQLTFLEQICKRY